MRARAKRAALRRQRTPGPTLGRAGPGWPRRGDDAAIGAVGPWGARFPCHQCKEPQMSVSAVNARTDVATQQASETYTVRHGDTLSAIARQLGVSTSSLLAANPQIRNANLIYPGDVLDIPRGGAPGGAANDPVADTSTSTPGGTFDYN